MWAIPIEEELIEYGGMKGERSYRGWHFGERGMLLAVGPLDREGSD